jgi:hypothetical protein
MDVRRVPSGDLPDTGYRWWVRVKYPHSRTSAIIPKSRANCGNMRLESMPSETRGEESVVFSGLFGVSRDGVACRAGSLTTGCLVRAITSS